MVQAWRHFSGVIPLFLIIAVVLFLLIRYKNSGQSMDWKNPFSQFMFILSIVGVLLVTLYTTYGSQQPRTINYVPFVGLYEMIEMIFTSPSSSVPFRNLGLNIILFVPFGFFLSWRTYLRQKSFFAIILKGFFFSLFIEICQYIFPTGRLADIDDVILNTCGAFLGCILWKISYSLLNFTVGSKKTGEYM